MVSRLACVLALVGSARGVCPYPHRDECTGIENPLCSAHPRCLHEGNTGAPGHRQRCCPDAHGTLHSCCGWRGDDVAYDLEPFEDTEFPADQSSLHIASLERPELMGSGVEWIRAMNLNRHHGDQLFTDVSPQDPKQGAIGDCWLVSCLSSAATHGHVIEEVFGGNAAVSNDGKYSVHLWDVREGEAGDWVLIEVDDQIPCRPRGNESEKAKPLFTNNHHDGDLWPLILEKAFAKFVGDYGHLVQGKSIWGWQALGACEAVYLYQPHKDTGTGKGKGKGKMGGKGKGDGPTPTPTQWSVFTNDIQAQREEMENQKAAGNDAWRRTMGPLRLRKDGGHALVSLDELFDHFNGMNQKGILAEVSCCQEAAGVPQNQHDAVHTWGIISGHAYSLLMARQFDLNSGETVKLLRIRNPWANGVVWLGDWGPNSTKWQEHPEMEHLVHDTLGEDRHAGSDGVFWMALADFGRIYREVEECVLKHDADQLWDLDDPDEEL